jgi:hypothetical protein
MHLYTNPKRGFKRIFNFEKARHFCSKQAVQKQWSLDNQKKSKQKVVFSNAKLSKEERLRVSSGKCCENYELPTLLLNLSISDKIAL